MGEADPDVVVVGGLRFHAMCPHHLLPYRGVAHVAYLPAGKLVGFGRLAELVDCFTKRLTLQERATHQIADALCRHLGARGAGCVIEAEQLCLALPGEKHDQSGVVTSAFVGEMRERPDLKARLLEAANLEGARGEAGGGQRAAVGDGGRRWPGIGRPSPARRAGAGARVAAALARAGARLRAHPRDELFRLRRRPRRRRRRASPTTCCAGSARPTCWSTTRASSRARRLEEMPVETWDAVVDSNLKGTFLVTRAFLRAMRARRAGGSSTSRRSPGRQGTALLSAYCAAKHGVVGLTRALAEELRDDGIAVNAVCPGSVDTEMLRVGMPGAKPRHVARGGGRRGALSGRGCAARPDRIVRRRLRVRPMPLACADRRREAALAVGAARGLPLFPLPNVVMFPHALLPLHIFEERYRAMTRDILAGDALPRPGPDRRGAEPGRRAPAGASRSPAWARW